MTPDAIINGATADGVQLLLYPNGLVKVAGKRGAVDRWRPLIAQNKTGIVGLLKPVPVTDTQGPVGEIRVTSRWWQFHYADGTVKEAAYSPAATRAEALASEPDAIKAKPFEPVRRQPDEPLTKKDEASVRALLTAIGETDEGMISMALDQCHTDQDAREAFLGMAKKVVTKGDCRIDQNQTD